MWSIKSSFIPAISREEGAYKGLPLNREDKERAYL